MPFSLLIKPAGPDCNLDCKYCFYSIKNQYFGENRHRMSDRILEKMILEFLALNFSQASFAWQGGEPALMGLDFYRKAVQLQKIYAMPNQQISNAFQTNATLINEEWCEFFHEYNFLVGISLDGPQKYHDYYRQDFQGQGTFDKVMQSIELCKKYKVEFNILVLLNDQNVKHPDELFDFFTNLGIKFLQFIPCVEKDPNDAIIADFAVTGRQYGEFMLRIFERWQDYGLHEVSIRLFDSIMNYIVYGRHSNCTFNKSCSDYIVIEHNGDAFCCDFFVGDDYKLGNLNNSSIRELYNSPVKSEFAASKRKISNKCFVCRYLEICRGGCLKDRMVISDDYKSLNHLCEGYKMIFEKIPKQLTEILKK